MSKIDFDHWANDIRKKRELCAPDGKTDVSYDDLENIIDNKTLKTLLDLAPDLLPIFFKAEIARALLFSNFQQRTIRGFLIAYIESPHLEKMNLMEIALLTTVLRAGDDGVNKNELVTICEKQPLPEQEELMRVAIEKGLTTKPKSRPDPLKVREAVKALLDPAGVGSYTIEQASDHFEAAYAKLAAAIPQIERVIMTEQSSHKPLKSSYVIRL